jgi:DNA polymerase III delta subunit
MRPTEFISLLRQGKLGPAYFLRGPDRFVQEECRAALVASIPAEAREWCLAEIEFEAGRIGPQLEAAYQMPMLGRHVFFSFSDPEDFKRAGDEDYEALAEYLERPSSFATLVFSASEPDRRRRFIQLLEKKAAVVEMLPLARREAAAWLSGYLRQAGVEIDPRLAEEIAARFEPSADSRSERPAGVNLLWLRTEMEKVLAAKADAKRIERADLGLIVAFREEHEIGKLLRAIAERQFGPALDHLRALIASKQPETLLLWSIGDLFRQAIKAAAGPADGRGSYGGARGSWDRSRNPFSTYEIAPLAVRKYSQQELLLALRHVRQADLGIKSSWKDSRILLEFLIWQILMGKGPGTSPLLTDELAAPSVE